MLAARRMMLSASTAAPPAPSPISSTGNSTGATNHVTTGSFTPTANALILVPAVIANGLSSAESITVSDTLGGLTWTQVPAGSVAGNGFLVALFWAIAPSSPIAGTVTLTGGNSSTWYTVGDVIQVTSGFTLASPIAQTANNVISGSGGSGTFTLTATLASAPSGTVIGILAQSYDNVSPVPPVDDANFTHLGYIQGVNSFDVDLDTSYATAQQSVTWSTLHRNSGGFWYYEGRIIEIQ